MTQPDSPTQRTPKRRFGIGARLSLAFALVVGLSSVACLAGLVIYERLSSEMQDIAQRELSRLSAATQLARVGSDVNARVSLLSRADNRSDFSRRRQDVDALLARLNEIIASSASWSDAGALTSSASELTRNLQGLAALAEQRFTQLDQIGAKVEELRWLQSDMISEIEPLIDDARFNIGRDLDNAAPKANIVRETARSEALLTALAQSNLAVGLLTRFAEVSNKADANDAFAFLDDTTDDLRSSIKVLSAWADSITVRQLANRVIVLADRVSGIPALKLSELSVSDQMNGMQVQAQNAVETLGGLIGVEVAQSERNSGAASANIDTFLSIGRALLLSITGLSIAGAIAVGYFYVHRNLVLNIRRLADEAVLLSDGPSIEPKDLKRDDELGDLAAALRQLRQTRDELIQSAKLAALGQMAAGIAHELNQPLSALRSHAFNGVRQVESGRHEDARATLGKMSDLVDRMAERIAVMRRFARLPDAELASASILTALEDALELLRHRFVERNATIHFDREQARGIDVKAQPTRLEQVLVNLLSNAVDALLDEGERRISITVQKDNSMVNIRISDTGAGVAPEARGQIFDPFFTTKEPGAGLGLGLSIAFNIVRDFGGRLVLEHSGREGSTFLIQLKEA